MALPENCIITINGRVESGNPQVNEDSCDTIELITRLILSQVRLPIPPLRRFKVPMFSEQVILY